MTDAARRGPAPKRIQRKRTKGWRMPAGAFYVGRPTRWGNPYPAQCFSFLRLYRRFLLETPVGIELAREARLRLRGKDLACWCPLKDKDGHHVPCHADVLLEIAND